MTFAESADPFTVLRFQPIRYGQEYWDQLTSNYKNVFVVESKASNRAEFIKELLNGDYANVNYIARTFQSVVQTGNYDFELLKLIVENTKVKGISHCGAGYDQVDAKACGHFKIQLSNIPDKVAPATADTNIFLMLATSRNFQIGHNNLLSGHWKSDINGAGTPIGISIQDKVVGILGMGGIGRTVRDRLSGFNVEKVIYYNRKRLSPELEKDSEYVSNIVDLIKQSDVISINIPLNEHTHHIINEEMISHMKQNVIIINTARGPIVDESAIKQGIKSGKIFGYGTDVFENEPDVDLELVQMDKVVSIPHLGAATYETVKSMEKMIVDNVENYYKTGKVLTLVPDLTGLF